MKNNTKGAYTLLGAGTHIEGEITVPHTVRIDGTIKGKIRAQQDVIIGKTGDVHADIEAQNIAIAGKVVGNLVVQERIELESDASLHGDLQARDLIIKEGAFFHGNCSMNETTDGKKRDHQASPSAEPVKDVQPDKELSL